MKSGIQSFSQSPLFSVCSPGLCFPPMSGPNICFYCPLFRNYLTTQDLVLTMFVCADSCTNFLWISSLLNLPKALEYALPHNSLLVTCAPFGATLFDFA